MHKYKTGLEAEIKKIISNNKGASVNAIMGAVMALYRGKVSGQKVMELIKKNI